MIEATDELYLSCKGTIEKACWEAWRRNPIIDLDDFRSYADEIFMDSVNSYTGMKGTKFNTWLTTQLLRLKSYAGRFKMVTQFNGKAESIVLSLDSAVGVVDGCSVTLQEVLTPSVEPYSKKLSAPLIELSWEEQLDAAKPFVGSLSDDAKTLLNDILDENVCKRDKNGVPVPEEGRKFYCKLTPRQLFVRLYRKRGWGFERVRDARIEIENLLRDCVDIKLPPPGNEVQVQDELF